jgi:hypothetical protein
MNNAAALTKNGAGIKGQERRILRGGRFFFFFFCCLILLD